MKTIIIVLVLTAAGVQTAAAQHQHGQRAEVPASVRAEHQDIHKALDEAMQLPGAVGIAARELQKVLHPHFVREEQIALPPLGVLSALMESEDVTAMAEWLLPMTDSLRTELPRMLAEHKTIGAARQKLAAAARAANNQKVVQLTDELGAHARQEEELLYPMAVLTGELVRARTQTGARPPHCPMCRQNHQ